MDRLSQRPCGSGLPRAAVVGRANNMPVTLLSAPAPRAMPTYRDAEIPVAAFFHDRRPADTALPDTISRDRNAS